MGTQKTFLAYVSAAVIAGFSFVANAQDDDFLSDDELQQAFQQAVNAFHNKPARSIEIDEIAEKAELQAAAPQPAAQIVEMDDIQHMLEKKLYDQKQAESRVVPIQQIQSATPSAIANMRPDNGVDVSILMDKPTRPLYENGVEIALGELRILVDMENVTLHQAVNGILQQAQDKTGPWLVKWRLKPDHEYLMREKVNLTAETTFGDFMSFLSERVNNMTGVNLFTRVFEGARVIVISDTYR